MVSSCWWDCEWLFLKMPQWEHIIFIIRTEKRKVYFLGYVAGKKLERQKRAEAREELTVWSRQQTDNEETETNQKNGGVADAVKERNQGLGSNTEEEKWPHLSSSFTTLPC